MNPVADEFKNQIQKTLASLQEDLKTIRSGRANPSVLEDLSVDAYGGQSKMRLREMATILSEDATTLSITPYDPSTMQDIEKAIQKSPLGLNPQPQGTKILIRIPPLNEEQRQKLVKVINQKVEEKKTIIRNHRDEARKKIKTQFEQKTITEDQKFRFEKDIDTLTQKSSEDIEVLREKKNQEIMQV